MTITAPTATTTDGVARRRSTRAHSRAAGIFYLLTFASSIPALILLAPILNDAGYVTGAGQDTRVLWGCLLDTVNALTAVGSAVAVYSVVKRQNGSMALGFVTSRLVEAAVVMIGVVSLLAVVTMRQDYAGSGADAASLTVTANALVSVRDWTFLFGPGLMPVFNALLGAVVLLRRRRPLAAPSRRRMRGAGDADGPAPRDPAVESGRSGSEPPSGRQPDVARGSVTRAGAER